MYKNATLATPVQTRDRRYSFANKSCYSSVQLILKTHYSYSLNKHVLNTWPQLFLLTSSFHWRAAMELQLDTLVSADRIEPNETYLYHKLKQYCGITTTTCEHLWEKKKRTDWTIMWYNRIFGSAPAGGAPAGGVMIVLEWRPPFSVIVSFNNKICGPYLINSFC